MKIESTEIVAIFDNVINPPYYHPKGTFVVPVLVQENYDTGGFAVINSHRGFSSKREAKNWIASNHKLIRNQ